MVGLLASFLPELPAPQFAAAARLTLMVGPKPGRHPNTRSPLHPYTLISLQPCTLPSDLAPPLICALFHFDVHLFFNLCAWASICLVSLRASSQPPTPTPSAGASASLPLQRHLGELSETASASKFNVYLPPAHPISSPRRVFVLGHS